MNLNLTKDQADSLFRETLRDLCGDYRIGPDGFVYDVTWCGDPSCGGHQRKIDESTKDAKRRLAAIALRGLL